MEKEKTFSEKLKEARELKGWTKTYAANYMSVPYMTWIQWENGSFEPPVYVKNGILEGMK